MTNQMMDIEKYLKTNVQEPRFLQYGKIFKASNYLIEATGLNAKIGTLCEIEISQSEKALLEVVGFKGDITYLMAYEELTGLSPNFEIKQLNEFKKSPMGFGLLGRVIDSYGSPLDALGKLKDVINMPLSTTKINPLEKSRISAPLDLGVKAINGLLTVGEGQRIGLMAGSGVGKSVLMGMIAKYSKVDVIVIALIGERSREVKEFIEDNLGSALSKTVMVVSSADSSPLNRIQAAEYATSIAEYFRDSNKRVLFLMDSVSRYAQAIRELGLALGEPPTTKGYPPSVFTKLPKLIERVGNGTQKGSSITAIYTVLAESDDIQDPIVDCARSILDGHIVLSRRLVEVGHFPAIDIEQSISRVMNSIISPEHLQAARLFKRYYSQYMKQKDFISLGAYQAGSDPEFDKIIKKMPEITKFLQQMVSEKSTFENDVQNLKNVING